MPSSSACAATQPVAWQPSAMAAGNGIFRRQPVIRQTTTRNRWRCSMSGRSDRVCPDFRPPGRRRGSRSVRAPERGRSGWTINTQGQRHARWAPAACALQYRWALIGAGETHHLLTPARRSLTVSDSTLGGRRAASLSRNRLARGSSGMDGFRKPAPGARNPANSPHPRRDSRKAPRRGDPCRRQRSRCGPPRPRDREFPRLRRSARGDS